MPHPDIDAYVQFVAHSLVEGCQQRGLSEEEAVALIVNGFCKEVMQNLPMEFAVEAQKLLAISLEGSVG